MRKRTSRWRSTALIAMMLTTGCSQTADERLAEVTRRSLDAQARQSEQLAAQTQQIAEASKRLVESDATARREIIAAQKDLQQSLQSERTSIDRQRDDLERDRRSLASQRQYDSLLAEAVRAAALLLACLLPLALAGYVLFIVSRSEPDDGAVNELLIREITSTRPRLLPGPDAEQRRIERIPEASSEAAAADDETA